MSATVIGVFVKQWLGERNKQGFTQRAGLQQWRAHRILERRLWVGNRP